jgi:hypothetical protein
MLEVLADLARVTALDIQRVACERASTWELPVGLVNWYLPPAGPFWYSGVALEGLNGMASCAVRE